MQHELRREENKIRMELLDLQAILIPHIESMQNHLQKAKDLATETWETSLVDA